MLIVTVLYLSRFALPCSKTTTSTVSATMHSIIHNSRAARNLLTTTERLFELILRTLNTYLPFDPLARLDMWFFSSASLVRNARALLGYPCYLTLATSKIQWDIRKLGRRQLFRCAFVKPRSFGLMIEAMEAQALRMETVLDSLMVLVDRSVMRCSEQVSLS